MSGPKYSYAKIEARRMNDLLNKLELELEKKRCIELTNKIKTKTKELQSLVSDYKRSNFNSIIEKIESVLPYSNTLILMKEQLDLANKKCIYIANTTGNSDSLSQELATLAQVIDSFKNLLALIRKTQSSLNTEYDKAVTEIKYNNYKNANWNLSNTPVIRQNTKVLKSYHKVLEVLIKHDEYESLQLEIEKILNNHQVDDYYKIKQMELRYQAIQLENNASNEIEQRTILEQECETLLKYLKKSTIDMPTDLNELEIMVKELHEELKKLTLSEYTAESMAEVMQNIGYTICAQEVLRNTTQIIERNLYEVSNQSFLNASTSNSGAVMFEVLAKKEGDLITANQKSKVKSDMERFCSDYSVIKQQLATKGISLVNENLYPVDEKYIRSIDMANISKESRRAARAGRKKAKYLDEGNQNL